MENNDLRLIRRFKLIRLGRHDTRRRYTDWNSVMPLAKIVMDETMEGGKLEDEEINMDLIGAICCFDIEEIKRVIVKFIKREKEELETKLNSK